MFSGVRSIQLDQRMRGLCFGELHLRANFTHVKIACYRIILRRIAQCIVRETRQLRGPSARLAVLEYRENGGTDSGVSRRSTDPGGFSGAAATKGRAPHTSLR